jgi:hypothetical protein
LTIYWNKDQRVPLPMRRSRYYSRMFLRAEDLSLTQDYLLSRQQVLFRQLVPSGVVSGLDLTPTGSDLMVAAGVATDADGSAIVLPEDVRVTLPPGDGTRLVTIHREEHAAELRDEGGAKGETRLVEEGRIELVAALPADSRYVPLGTVTRQNGVVRTDLTSRRLSGLRVQAGAVTPTVGNHRQAGIQFPADSGGGSGDEAFIRYYVRGGEHASLLIGVNNDAEDTIDFLQGGVERLRIAGGMLYLGGINDQQRHERGQLVSGLGFVGRGTQHGQLSFRAGYGFEMVDRSRDFPGLDYSVDVQPYADLTLRSLAAREDVVIGAGKAIRGQGMLHVDGPDRLYLLNQKGVHITAGWHAGDPDAGHLHVERNIVLGDVLAGRGRLHLDGPERLYLMNQGGVRVEAGWHSGNPAAGTVHVQRSLAVQHEPSQIPSWSGGGVVTFDMFATGGIYCGRGGDDWPIKMFGDGVFYAKKKNFAIDHPLDPVGRTLVHSAIEGPEYGVYYRGEGALTDGRAVVELPEYFEALTRPEGRTVQLTPRFDGDEEISALAASAVREGRFTVRAVGGAAYAHGFYWEVKAVRADVEEIDVEVGKASLLPNGGAEMGKMPDS